MSQQKLVNLAEQKRKRTFEQLEERRRAVLNAKYKLVPEQQQVLDWVKEGHNVKLTGEGGSGKTVTLMAIIKYLTSRLQPFEFAICASTGSAAVHLQVGKTVHSVFKLIPGTEALSPEEHYEQNIAGKMWVEGPLKKLRTIVIDEDSMLKAVDLDKIDHICRMTSVKWNRATRKEEPQRHLPFGGKQVVLCGDFSQLPPVFTDNSGPGNHTGQLLFESEAYANGRFREVMLKTNHRQRTDVQMQYVLNCIRKGVVNDFVKQCLGQLRIPLEYRELNGLDAVACKLHCTNADVSKYNLAQLRKLEGPEVVFQSMDAADGSHEYMLKNMRYPKVLNLRKGAKVRLLKNLDINMNLVNGTPGVVMGFKNIPDDLPEDEVCRVFCEHDAVDEDKKFGVKVRFWLAEGVHYDMVINCDMSENRGARKVLASRLQIPLKLTFATTVHAAQGQTHPCFELDLSDAFEAGQGYVGLSRGTTLNGVHLSGFDPARIRCDPRVVEFYKRFETEQTRRAEQELEEKALALGPFKVPFKEEFKHLEGTLRTDFDDMDSTNSRSGLKRKRDPGDSKPCDEEEEEKEPLFLLVTGSREMADAARMGRCLKKLIEGQFKRNAVTIVTGDEPGTETLAAEFARENGYALFQQKMEKQPGSDDEAKRASKAKRLYRNAGETVVFQLKSQQCSTVEAFVAERAKDNNTKRLFTYNF